MLPLLPGIAETFGINLRSDPTLLRAQILDLPLQLLEAPAPVAISGVVADAGAAGQVRVTTPVGDVQLRLGNEIPVGGAVQIVIRPGARLEAFILPGPAATASPTAAVPPPPATPAAAAATGSLLAPAAAKPETGPVPAAHSAAAPASPGVTAAPNAPLAGAGAAVAPEVVMAGGEATKTAAPAPAPPAVRLPTPPTLSPSSILATLGVAEMPEAVSAGGNPYAIPYAVAAQAPASELVALVTDMRRLVAARDPTLAERLMRRLPGTDRAGAVALATLPVAAQRNALAAWFGHAIKETLDEAGGGNLLDVLTADLTNPSPRKGDTTSADWHWRQLPVVDHGQIYPVQIGVAPDRDQPQSGSNAAPRQRPRIYEFAVEVSLSNLGRTRIDATYQQRRLDLVVPCESEIGKEARERIVTAIAGVFDEFGLGGSCRFEPPAGAAAAAVKV